MGMETTIRTGVGSLLNIDDIPEPASENFRDYKYENYPTELTDVEYDYDEATGVGYVRISIKRLSKSFDSYSKNEPLVISSSNMATSEEKEDFDKVVESIGLSPQEMKFYAYSFTC